MQKSFTKSFEANLYWEDYISSSYPILIPEDQILQAFSMQHSILLQKVLIDMSHAQAALLHKWLI